jgi:hypothetical protein
MIQRIEMLPRYLMLHGRTPIRGDKQQAPDSAKIPVTVRLTPSQVRTVLNAFVPWIEGQSDREVYTLVKNALDAIE